MPLVASSIMVPIWNLRDWRSGDQVVWVVAIVRQQRALPENAVCCGDDLLACRGEDFDLVLKPRAQPIAFGFKVEVSLEVKPELRGGPEEPREPKRRVCRDGPVAVHDFVYAARWNADGVREAVLRKFKRHEEVF